MEMDDSYFGHFESIELVYNSVIQYIEKYLYPNEPYTFELVVDEMLIKFHEAYFNYFGLNEKREIILELLNKFLYKHKKKRTITVILAFFDFYSILRNKLDDLDSLHTNLITEYSNDILALEVQNPTEEVLAYIKEELVLKKDNDHYKYRFKNNRLTVIPKDTSLVFKSIRKKKHNYITKTNLICLETYIRDHFELTKRNTTNFKSTFLDVSNHLTSGLSTDYKVQVLPFGSVTQFSQNISSDLEITVITDYPDEDQVIRDIVGLLKENSNFISVKLYETKRTKIIKLTHKLYAVNIELMLNNYLGVLNSELIRKYCLLDARVAILINVIKDWSKIHSVNGNFNKYLSSYCYTLMVIYFLQKEVKILPILQGSQFENDLFMKDSNGKDCHYLIDINRTPQYIKTDGHSMAELVYKFFYFYLYCFNENDYSIDISCVNVVFRDNEIKYLNYFNHEAAAYCFVDPFDYGYNPGTYMKKKSESFKYFKEELEAALEKITNINKCENIFKRKL
jgi:hypothetical protein